MNVFLYIKVDTNMLFLQLLVLVFPFCILVYFNACRNRNRWAGFGVAIAVCYSIAQNERLKRFAEPL